MKRLIATISLSVLALPAFASEAARNYGLDEHHEGTRPFLKMREYFASREPLAAGRTAPDIEGGGTLSAASSGQTRRDRGKQIEDSFKSIWATGPWANDHHFISPR